MGYLETHDWKRLSASDKETVWKLAQGYIDDGWQIQSNGICPQRGHVVVMMRPKKLDPDAVDEVFTHKPRVVSKSVDDTLAKMRERHGVCPPEVTDSEIAQIGPCKERVPTSDESIGRAIHRLVIAEIQNYGLTTHEACQEIAIKTNRSYEWVRGQYDRVILTMNQIFEQEGV